MKTTKQLLNVCCNGKISSTFLVLHERCGRLTENKFLDKQGRILDLTAIFKVEYVMKYKLKDNGSRHGCDRK